MYFQVRKKVTLIPPLPNTAGPTPYLIDNHNSCFECLVFIILVIFDGSKNGEMVVKQLIKGKKCFKLRLGHRVNRFR